MSTPSVKLRLCLIPMSKDTNHDCALFVFFRPFFPSAAHTHQIHSGKRVDPAEPLQASITQSVQPSPASSKAFGTIPALERRQNPFDPTLAWGFLSVSHRLIIKCEICWWITQAETYLWLFSSLRSVLKTNQVRWVLFDIEHSHTHSLCWFMLDDAIWL